MASETQLVHNFYFVFNNYFNRYDLLYNLLNNIFSLENEQLSQIVQCMEKKSVEPKNDIIIEGSVGERLFVLASGKVQVLQNDRVVHNLSSQNGGIVLGELVIIILKTTYPLEYLSKGTQANNDITITIMSNNVYGRGCVPLYSFYLHKDIAFRISFCQCFPKIRYMKVIFALFSKCIMTKLIVRLMILGSFV